MKSRCYCSNDKDYKNYGSRGIFICEEWLKDFMNFYNWAMNNGYKSNLTIDRINVSKGYEPNNCRWATAIEQCNNRRSNVLIEYKGKKDTMANLARKYKVKYHVLADRLSSGWSVNKAIETPVVKKMYIYKGITGAPYELAKELKIDKRLLQERLRNGWDISKAIETPKIIRRKIV